MYCFSSPRRSSKDTRYTLLALLWLLLSCANFNSETVSASRTRKKHETVLAHSVQSTATALRHIVIFVHHQTVTLILWINDVVVWMWWRPKQYWATLVNINGICILRHRRLPELRQYKACRTDIVYQMAISADNDGVHKRRKVAHAANFLYHVRRPLRDVHLKVKVNVVLCSIQTRSRFQKQSVRGQSAVTFRKARGNHRGSTAFPPFGQ